MTQGLRILLIQPPLEDFYTTPIRFYPLGLLYAARVLNELGHQVKVLDCLTPLRKRELPIPADFDYLKPFIKKDPYLFQHYYRFGLADETIVAGIKAYAPDMIGIAAQFTAYFKSVAELAALIKTHCPAPIFVGGNHASAFAEKIRERTPQIDHVLCGPAESCLPQFFGPANRKALPLDWRSIQPEHALLEPGRYKIGAKNTISLTASRGCPYQCDFCSTRQMFGNRIAYRPVDAVMAELRKNYTFKQARLFNFEDDNLTFDRTWFCDLLTAILEDPVLKEIELTAMNGICHAHLNAETLELMRRAGFRRLNLSLVTRNTGLQKRYHRPDGGTGLPGLIAEAQKRNFLITVYVIIGLPGQSFQEIRESIDYLLGLGVLVGPSIFYIPPASPLYAKLDLPAALRDNWNLYRSSAFAVETDQLTRPELIRLFSYVRQKNLENRHESKTG